MFDIASNLLIDLCKMIPSLVAIILAFNLCAYLLWERGE